MLWEHQAVFRVQTGNFNRTLVQQNALLAHPVHIVLFRVWKLLCCVHQVHMGRQREPIQLIIVWDALLGNMQVVDQVFAAPVPITPVLSRIQGQLQPMAAR